MAAPVIAAAGLTAAAGLFQALMQQEAAKEQAARQEQMAREAAARDRLAQAQRDQLSTVQSMGQGEQSAISNLMAALARTQR
jgi:hypothetical protein